MPAHDRDSPEQPSRYRSLGSMPDLTWPERPPPTRPPRPLPHERPFLPPPEPRALRMPPRPPNRKRYLVRSFAVLCLVNFLCALDGSILSVALPVRARTPPQVEQTLTWLAHHERPSRLGLRGFLGRDVFPPGVGGPAAAVGRAVGHRRSEEHSPGGAAAVHPGVRPGGG